MGDGRLDTMELTRMAELGSTDLRAWSALQQRTQTLSSPFFHPVYHRLVDESRAAGEPRIEAVVGRDRGGQMVFVWPFEREGARLAVPAGQFLTDYQGVVAEPRLRVDPRSLLRTAGLDRWRFDHVPVDQPSFAEWRRATAPSLGLGLADGFASWAGAVKSVVRDTEGQRRRLERRVGPVRFERRCLEPSVLEALMAWKSAQYRATGKRDVFAIAWCRRLVGALLKGDDDEGMEGWLSALWAGDQLAAAHLGLRSGRVWHYWLPAYDPELGRYSPGLVLLLEMARQAPDAGIELIDLGKGDEPYKRRVATTEVVVSSGVVEVPNLRAAARAVGRWARDTRRRMNGSKR